MLGKQTKQHNNNLRNELGYECYLILRTRTKKAHSLFPNHSLTHTLGSQELGYECYLLVKLLIKSLSTHQ